MVRKLFHMQAAALQLSQVNTVKLNKLCVISYLSLFAECTLSTMRWLIVHIEKNVSHHPMYHSMAKLP